MKDIYLLILVSRNKIEEIYPMAFESLCQVLQKSYELFGSRFGSWFIVPIRMTNSIVNTSLKEKVKTYTKF